MRRRPRAFTLIEILIVLVISGVSMTGLMLSLKPPKQTAEREARRVMRFLQNATDIADRTQRKFTVPRNISKGIKIEWQSGPKKEPELTLMPSQGCSFKLKSSYSIDYRFKSQTFQGGTIIITGADGSTYYVIVSVQGRIRMTPIDD